MNSRTGSDSLDNSSKGEQRTVSLLFDQQVARTPLVVAIVSGAQELRYQQLAQGAGRLARDLESMGVRQESLVGVFYTSGSTAKPKGDSVAPRDTNRAQRRLAARNQGGRP